MDSLTVKITGLCPLIMHNWRLANPFDPFSQKIKAITSKRKKTEDDQLQLHRIEWEGGLYWDAKIGLYIPSLNIESMINDGARLFRRGQDVWRAVIVPEEKVPLTSNWPKHNDLDKIFESGEFTDIRTIVNPSTGSRTLRCRAIIRDWSLTFTATFDPGVIDRKDLLKFIEEGGNKFGLCDAKPRYGRFSTEEVGEQKVKKAA